MQHLNEWQLINYQEGQTTQSSIYVKPPLCHTEKPSSDPNSFPWELLLSIFNFLEKPRDLITASLTCHKWHLVSQDETLKARKQILRSIPALNSTIKSIEQILFLSASWSSSLRPDVVFKIPYEQKGIKKLWTQNQKIYLYFENGIFACLNLKNHQFNEIYREEPTHHLLHRKIDKRGHINWIKLIDDKALIHFDTNFKLIDLDTEEYIDYSFHIKVNECNVAIWEKNLFIFSQNNLYHSEAGYLKFKITNVYSKPNDFSISIFEHFLIINRFPYIDILNLKTDKWHLTNQKCKFYIPLLFQKTPTLFIEEEEGNQPHIFHRLFKLESKESKLIRISTKVTWHYDCLSQTLLSFHDSRCRLYDITKDKKFSYQFEHSSGDKLSSVYADILRKYGNYYLTYLTHEKKVLIWRLNTSSNSMKLYLTLGYHLVGDMLYQINKKEELEIINLQAEKDPSNKIFIIEYKKNSK